MPRLRLIVPRTNGLGAGGARKSEMIRADHLPELRSRRHLPVLGEVRPRCRQVPVGLTRDRPLRKERTVLNVSTVPLERINREREHQHDSEPGSDGMGVVGRPGQGVGAAHVIARIAGPILCATVMGPTKSSPRRRAPAPTGLPRRTYWVHDRPQHLPQRNRRCRKDDRGGRLRHSSLGPTDSARRCGPRRDAPNVAEPSE